METAMNLFRKLTLTLLCAIGFAGLCAQAGASNFNLTAFMNAEEPAQVQMLSALLQDKTLSDAEIAHVLEVKVKTVEKARKFFGPLELNELLRRVNRKYNKRCHAQFVKDIWYPMTPWLVGVLGYTTLMGIMAVVALQLRDAEIARLRARLH